jgi:hypothetical protein
MDNDMRVSLGFDVDQASVNQAKKAIQGVSGDLKDTAASAKAATKEIAKAGSGTSTARRVGGIATQGAGLAQRFAGNVPGLAEGAGIIQLTENLSGMAKASKKAAEAAGNKSGMLTNVLANLGPVGLAAGAAIAAVGVAITIFANESKKAAEETKRAFEAERSVAMEAAGGKLTKQAAEERIKILQAEAAREKEILEKSKAEHEAYIEKQGGGLKELATRAFDANEEQLNQQVHASEEANKTREAQIKALQAEIARGLPVEDAAVEAEKSLTAARSGGTASADDASTAAKEAADEQKKQAEEAAQAQIEAAQKAADAQRNYAEAVQDTNTEMRRSISDAQEGARNDLRDMMQETRDSAAQSAREANDARMQADVEYQRESEAAARENQRAIKDIIKNANREQQDLLAERDFLSLDMLSKQTQRDLEDTGETANVEADERAIAQQQKVTDMRRDFDIETRERNVATRQKQRDIQIALQDEIKAIRVGASRKIQDAATALQRELELARQGVQTKLGLEQQYWSASIGMARSALGSLGAAPVTNNRTNNVSINQTVNGSNLSAGALQQMMLGTIQSAGLAS